MSLSLFSSLLPSSGSQWEATGLRGVLMPPCESVSWVQIRAEKAEMGLGRVTGRDSIAG